MKPPFSIEKLKKYFSYDPITGSWRRILFSPRQHNNRKLGHLTKEGYLRFTVFGGRYLAHVLAWFYMTGVWPDRIVDHKDNNPGNMKWKNLRLATSVQNKANSKCRSDNVLGIKGVCRVRGFWRARIYVSGKSVHLGYFTSVQEAHNCYMEAATQQFGEFARPK